MKVKFLFLLVVICLCVSGCAARKLPRSDIPEWDADVPLDNDSSLSKSLFNIFSDGSNYHFRKVRWGFSRDRVELSEAGNTVTERRDNAIVYKCKLNGVYCKLIYTFKDNRLRTAGYITDRPIPNADNLIKSAVDTHGMPDTHSVEPGGSREEMVWKTPETVIFTNLYPSVRKLSISKHKYSTGGLLKELLQERLAKRKPGVIRYWDGVYSHVDMAFYNELHEVNFPEAELSFYEKQLLGIILRGSRTYIPGVGTIPNN